MAQTCPHCGVTLPTVVDAFCPQCREDLSATPEEARETAKLTRAAVLGTPEEEQSKGAVYLLLATVGAAIGLITAVLEGEWIFAVVALIVLAIFGEALVRHLQGLFVKTSVSGRDKTSKKGSDQLQ